MGRDDLDPYGSGVDGSRVARGVARILVALVGLALGVFGVAAFALRCFDTCPADPGLDKVLQLLPAALVLVGVVLVVEAATFRTRWAGPAAGVVAVLGALVALAGIVSLALVPTIDRNGGGTGGLAASAVVAVVVGGAIVAARSRSLANLRRRA